VSTPPEEPGEGEREGAGDEAGGQPHGGAPRGVVLAVLAALAVIGAIVAFVVVRDSGSSSSSGTTGADVTVPTAIGVVTTPAPGGTTTARTRTTAPSVPTQSSPAATTPTHPTQATTAAGTWPVGVSGYTVVLRSLPKSGTSEQQARAVARGIAGVSAGVLDSSRYASLHPGWWVVYAGRYATLTQANAAAARLRAAGHAGVYARRVSA
jgi:hypothetical protein